MAGFIAVHCGAGFHKSSLRGKYKKLCREACEAGARILNAGGTAFLACQTAVMILEDSPLTNAGFGSSLSYSGEVECDASIMDGENLNFGSCGAVKGVQYPISLASQICIDQTQQRPLQLIPPMTLVGQGATDYAKKSNLSLVNNKRLISKKARKRHRKNLGYLKGMGLDIQKFGKTNIGARILMDKAGGDVDIELNTDNNQDSSSSNFKNEDVVMGNHHRLDTVGAVCVDSRGQVASACSSGGLAMKYDGRIGQAATYASGVWADSQSRTENGIAVSTTGAGEYLIKTLLAKELAHKIKDSPCPAHAFLQCMKDDFLESKLLSHANYKICGALVLHVSPSGQGELLWGHTSRSMGIAYMDSTRKQVKATFTELPPPKEGLTVTLSGIKFDLRPEGSKQ